MNDLPNKPLIEYRGYTVDLIPHEHTPKIRAVATDALNREVAQSPFCQTWEGAVVAVKAEIDRILDTPAKVDPEKANEGLRLIAREHFDIIDQQQTLIEMQKQGLDRKDKELAIMQLRTLELEAALKTALDWANELVAERDERISELLAALSDIRKWADMVMEEIDDPDSNLKPISWDMAQQIQLKARVALGEKPSRGDLA